MVTSSTKPRSTAWAAILALAMVTSLSPAICLAAAIPLSTLLAKVMVFHCQRPGEGNRSPHPRGAYRVPVIPTVGLVEQAPSAHQGAGGGQSLPQHLRTAFIDLERQAFGGGWHGHRARLIPAEQLGYAVLRVGDEPLLLFLLMGFLPPSDKRMRATVLAIADELTKDDLVLRYRVEGTDTGFSGEEGTFTICSFWLVSALAMIGETHRARQAAVRRVASALRGRSTPTGEHLGNFPQRSPTWPDRGGIAAHRSSSRLSPRVGPVRDRKLPIRTDRGACPGATLTPPLGVSRPADEGGHIDHDSPAHRGMDVIRWLASHSCPQGQPGSGAIRRRRGPGRRGWRRHYCRHSSEFPGIPGPLAGPPPWRNTRISSRIGHPGSRPRTAHLRPAANRAGIPADQQDAEWMNEYHQALACASERA